MSNYFKEELSIAERRQILKDNCTKMESGSYVRVLTNDDVLQKREQLSDACIKQRELEDEKKALMDSMKHKIDPVKDEVNLLLTEIKTGQEDKIGDLFLMADYATSEIIYYDELGEDVRRRRMKPEEKQGKMFQVAAGFMKEGTNN